MCGRYTLKTDITRLQDRFSFDTPDVAYTPSYNVAPSQQVLAVVSSDGGTRTELLRWGLVPSWAKDPKVGHRLINARAETVAEKPSFRRALRKRRCLILADGFYEWRRDGERKIPMYIRLQSQEPFAFAGLWERWQTLASEPLLTCTILATTANTFMQPIHQRMPVIPDSASKVLWLDHEASDPLVLLPMLPQAASHEMEAYAVSTTVNSPSNNCPACIGE